MIYVMFRLLEKVIFIFDLESIVRLIISLNSYFDVNKINQTHFNFKVLIYDT